MNSLGRLEDEFAQCALLGLRQGVLLNILVYPWRAERPDYTDWDKWNLDRTLGRNAIKAVHIGTAFICIDDGGALAFDPTRCPT